MNVHVGADVRINLNGVKSVLAVVVVAQREVNFAWNQGAALFGMEPDIQVGHFKHGNGRILPHLTKVNVAHADPDTALVLPAFGR